MIHPMPPLSPLLLVPAVILVLKRCFALMAPSTLSYTSLAGKSVSFPLNSAAAIQHLQLVQFSPQHKHVSTMHSLQDGPRCFQVLTVGYLWLELPVSPRCSNLSLLKFIFEKIQAFPNCCYHHLQFNQIRFNLHFNSQYDYYA